MVRVWCGLLLCVFLGSSLQAQGADDEAVFKERLTAWVSAVKSMEQDKSEESVQKVDGAFKELQKFSREYPGSRYADDAEFIRYNGTEVPLEQWEEFVAKYPEGRLEDLTREQLRGLTGTFSSFAYECLIPYELLPVYMRGQRAWLGRDYKEAEKYLADFVQKVDLYYGDLRRDILDKPYFNLLTACKAQKKRPEYDKIKAKYIKLFPEKSGAIECYW